ncbi:sortase B protein-sorting domain-containing protein [Coprococcus comes]|uniref:sortase B protein-sorting domain-containing protein n=1 Tax=Coprococcus comes TaxID=410072 RepID=UPI0032BFA106
MAVYWSGSKSDRTNTVKTGDTARVLLFCVLALISGLILLAYGIYTLNKNTKRRRQKGE